MPNFLLSVDSRQSCILDSRYWITNSLSVDLGFRILIVSYSLSRFTDSKAQGFRIAPAKIPESGLPYMGRQNKETNIGKEVGKKLRFATMDLEACLSLFDVYF